MAPTFEAQNPVASAVTPPAGLRAAMMASVAQVSTLNVWAPTESAPWETPETNAVDAEEAKNPNTTSRPDR